MILKTYLDTSALVKLYYPEAESSLLAEWVKGNNQPLFYTSLQELELKNALALKKFRREISAKEFQSISKMIQMDTDAGVLYRPLMNWGGVFSHALGIIATHTKKIGCRSLDLLHVALATTLDCVQFITFDERQGHLAQSVGFQRIPIG